MPVFLIPYLPYLIAAGAAGLAYWYMNQRQALPPPRARLPAPGVRGPRPPPSPHPADFVGPPAPPGTRPSQPPPPVQRHTRGAETAEELPAPVVNEGDKTYFEGSYDPAAAPHLAVTLNVDLADRRPDKLLVRAFQAAAGVRVDGAYGPITKGALRYWLRVAGSHVEPPTALSGSGEVAYVAPDGIRRLPEEQVTEFPGKSERDNWPAVTRCDHQGATLYAPIVAQFMKLGRGYKRNADAMHALRAFQLASGLEVDGDYGKSSYHALVYWLKASSSSLRAPPAVFGGSATGYTPCAPGQGSAMSGG